MVMFWWLFFLILRHGRGESLKIITRIGDGLFWQKSQFGGMHPQKISRHLLLARLAILFAATRMSTTFLPAQTTNEVPTLQIKGDQITGKVSSSLYGLMTEEINFSYEGGLYGELIRNRTFKADTNVAKF